MAFLEFSGGTSDGKTMQGVLDWVRAELPEDRGHKEDGYGWSGGMAWRGDWWQWRKEEAGGGCGGRSGKGRAERGFCWILQDFEEEGGEVEENGWRHWKEEQKLSGGAHQGQNGWSKATGATDFFKEAPDLEIEEKELGLLGKSKNCSSVGLVDSTPVAHFSRREEEDKASPFYKGRREDKKRWKEWEFPALEKVEEGRRLLDKSINCTTYGEEVLRRVVEWVYGTQEIQGDKGFQTSGWERKQEKSKPWRTSEFKKEEEDKGLVLRDWGRRRKEKELEILDMSRNCSWVGEMAHNRFWKKLGKEDWEDTNRIKPHPDIDLEEQEVKRQPISPGDKIKSHQGPPGQEVKLDYDEDMEYSVGPKLATSYKEKEEYLQEGKKHRTPVFLLVAGKVRVVSTLMFTSLKGL
ncbi:hypothetical protein BY996DRAFT_6443087 [Phakopsora pachyrhizi]|nr:hypothetical protein BY996DRAFT_6443087 [Phakopsora pachyrhizi]